MHSRGFIRVAVQTRALSRSLAGENCSAVDASSVKAEDLVTIRNLTLMIVPDTAAAKSQPIEIGLNVGSLLRITWHPVSVLGRVMPLRTHNRQLRVFCRRIVKDGYWYCLQAATYPEADADTSQATLGGRCREF